MHATTSYSRRQIAWEPTRRRTVFRTRTCARVSPARSEPSARTQVVPDDDTTATVSPVSSSTVTRCGVGCVASVRRRVNTRAGLHRTADVVAVAVVRLKSARRIFWATLMSGS